MKTITLDDATADMLSEYAAQIQTANTSRLAVLNHFIRQQKLAGNWALNPDGKSISQPEGE